MDQTRRSSIAFGLILILVGAWFLATQLVPGLEARLGLTVSWPLIIVGIGLLFLLFAIFAGIPGMAVPGCVIGGIGLLLYWQNLTNNWQSWAYAWTLIPGFVGVGTILIGILGPDRRGPVIGGIWLVVISGVLFLVFSSFLGGPNLLGPYWPVLLIALGILLLFQSLFRYRT